MASPVATSRTAVATRPSRKLQWLAVVVGFLFFVLLLVEGALLVLGSTGSAVTFVPAQGGSVDPMLVLLSAAGALVLGSLTLFFAAACAGRYRFLVKVAAVLLFLGALSRLAWPLVLETGIRTGAFTTGQFRGMQLFTGPDPLIPASLAPNLHWFAMGPALLLTLLGLLGLVLFAPKRVAAAPVANDIEPSTGPRAYDAGSDRPGPVDSDANGQAPGASRLGTTDATPGRL